MSVPRDLRPNEIRRRRVTAAARAEIVRQIDVEGYSIGELAARMKKPAQHVGGEYCRGKLLQSFAAALEDVS